MDDCQERRIWEQFWKFILEFKKQPPEVFF